MRRVLLADDPRLAPRLARLQEQMGGSWDVVIVPRDQVQAWRQTQFCRGVVIVPAGEVDSQIPGTESTDVVVAACSPPLLKIASNLGFRRESHIAVLPQAAQTADWIFSLYPLSEDKPPRVRGVFEHRGSAAVQAFERQLPSAPADRHLAAACTLPVSKLTTADIEALFIEDVDLLRMLAGEFRNLIAVAIPHGGDGLRSVTVTFGGEGAGSVAWTVQSGSAFHWELKSTTAGRFILTRDSDGEFRAEGLSPGPSTTASSPDADWENVLRAFDDLAALRRSLRKRRLVELETETVSERAQFKSLMSASGCGLLVMTLIGAVCLLGAGAAFDPRESLQRTSERAGLVLRAGDFQSTQNGLTKDAAEKWPGMVHRLSHSAAPILVERTDNLAQDEQRRDALVAKLASAGVPSPASRVELYRFRGDLFLRLLTAAWVVLFLPLGVFLAFQGLLLAAPRTAPSDRVE